MCTKKSARECKGLVPYSDSRTARLYHGGQIGAGR